MPTAFLANKNKKGATKRNSIITPSPTKEGNDKQLRDKSPKQDGKQEHRNKIFLPVNFVNWPEKQITLDHIQSHHVHLWKHRSKQHLPGDLAKECTVGERESCLEEVVEFMDKVKKCAAAEAAQLLLDNAAKNCAIKREWDGQEYTNWKDLKAFFVQNKGTKDETIYNCLYKHVLPGWELDKEARVLKTLKLEYRPWLSKEKQPKGFVAKCCSLGMNIKRKDIPWIKRREEAHIGEDGTKIV